ncbi:MAG: ribosome maturation factor RimM [Clostridia bacterium]|nr:ribosome maturation factor RimM [Clostridia bacterium]
MGKQKYLECAKAVNTHGIRGEIKFESLCDTPEKLAGLGRIYLKNGMGFDEYRIRTAYVKKRFVIASLEGIDDIDAAEAMRDKYFFADRDDMPLEDGEYFIADLIGLPVIDADSGHKYGVISDVFNSGASDIYTVATPEGERMIPAVPEFVIRVDCDEGVYVRPIEGMFD